jgi:hypothetical protein
MFYVYVRKSNTYVSYPHLICDSIIEVTEGWVEKYVGTIRPNWIQSTPPHNPPRPAVNKQSQSFFFPPFLPLNYSNLTSLCVANICFPTVFSMM